MATIDNRKMIVDFIKNDGHYSDDPQLQTIWAYYSVMAKRECWAVYYHTGEAPYGPYALDPILLWGAPTGITGAGAKFMEGDKDLIDCSTPW